MPRASRVCTTPGCPTLVDKGRCADCRRKAEQARGTATQRGYGSQHRKRFRRRVLDRDKVCVLCQAAPAVHADHWPTSRRDLVAAGLDPNDPQHGRGLCPPCHSKHTAAEQPGGWNVR